MNSRLRRILGSADAESGQLLIMAAGTMTFVLSLAAIAIDVGFWAQTKRDLQNDVDAMVLAGTREMPDTASAQTVALTWDNSCLLKIPSPSDTWTSGNTGPIRLDEGGEPGNYALLCHPGSSGAAEYRENIEDGSECSYAVNDEIRTKPGNMTGPTCTAISNKLGSNVETVADVFGTPNAAGFHTEVNKFSPRYGLIPVVYVPPGAAGSSTNVTITGFISVYIEGACSGVGCNGNGGNPACVVVTPIKSIIFLPGVAFASGGSLGDEKNALRTMKLID